MAEQQGSSFIPKAGAAPVRRTGVTRRIYLLSYISYIIFFSVLFATVGLFVYGAFVDRTLAGIQEQLAAEQANFSSEEVESVHRLDERLATAQRLLDESAAPSRLFSDIEQVVASNIVFSGMIYERLPNNRFSIVLTGVADDFNQVLHQRDLMKNSLILQNASVEEFDYSVTGDENASTVSGQAVLTFIFSDTRDLSSIPYLPAGFANATVSSFESEETTDSTATATTSIDAVEVVSERPVVNDGDEEDLVEEEPGTTDQ